MKIELNTNHGPAVLNILDTGWRRGIKLQSPEGHDEIIEIGLTIPNRDGNLGDGILIGGGSSYGHAEPSEVRETIRLQQIALDLSDLWNEAFAAEIAEAEAEAERRQKEYEAKQAARRELVAERTQQLMTEFLGETVRVREPGKKVLHKATVDVVPVRGRLEDGSWGETGEYKPWLRYHIGGDNQNVDLMRRCDVLVGSRFQTVWDDGNEDLGYDGEAPGLPANREYDGGLC